MARFEMNDSITALIEDLDRAADNLPTLRKDILNAEADVLVPALKSEISASGLIDTGTFRDSIDRSTRKKETLMLVGPSGVHHTYVARSGGVGELRNGHLGYLHEYGCPRRGIRPKNWMSRAVQKSQGKAFEAAEEVHNKYLKTYNL